VLEAIRKAADGDLRRYPDPENRALREAAAARFGVKVEEVFAGNGSDEVLAFAFGAFFEGPPSDPVLFPDVSYSFYPVYADLWGVPWETVPLSPDFSLDFSPYRRPSGGVVIANPNAPTGILAPTADLLALTKTLDEAGKVLLVDEAYIDFAAGGKSPSLVSAVRECPNLLVVRTLSKSASLAGLRVGFALGQEHLIQGLRRMRDSFNSYTLDSLAQAGAAAALADRAYYDTITERVIATRERFSAALRKMGLEVLPSAANFVFARAADIPGSGLYTALRERGILVRRFNKDRIADFVRISIGTDDEMDGFLSVLESIVDRGTGLK
jgi:histidinol-phosphate aminotransferase